MVSTAYYTEPVLAKPGPDVHVLTQAREGEKLHPAMEWVRWSVRTANCIILDHSSAFEPGLVAPFLYAA
jgi:hypothetical protein